MSKIKSDKLSRYFLRGGPYDGKAVMVRGTVYNFGGSTLTFSAKGMTGYYSPHKPGEDTSVRSMGGLFWHSVLPADIEAERIRTEQKKLQVENAKKNAELRSLALSKLSLEERIVLGLA